MARNISPCLDVKLPLLSLSQATSIQNNVSSLCRSHPAHRSRRMYQVGVLPVPEAASVLLRTAAPSDCCFRVPYKSTYLLTYLHEHSDGEICQTLSMDRRSCTNTHKSINTLMQTDTYY